MKNISRIGLLACLLMTGISYAQNNGTTSVPIDQGYNVKQYKPSKKMVSLNVLQKEFRVKKGGQCYYAGSVHGSVGNTLSVWAEGKGLKLADTHFNYDDPSKARMSGGDGGTKYFVFDARKAGEYTVVVEKSFRGEVQNTYRIKVIVE